MAYLPILDNELDVNSGITDTMPARLAQNVEEIVTQTAGAPSERIKFGADLVWVGNSATDVVISSFLRGGGFYTVRNLTVNPAQALLGLSGMVVIRANTSITVNGSIRAEVDYLNSPPQNPSRGTEGGVGATGGTQSNLGGYPPTKMWGMDSNAYSGSGAPPTGESRDASSASAGAELVSGLSHFLMGARGNGATGAVADNAINNDGGQGGGTIVLISPSITIAASGSLLARGEDGFAGSGTSGCGAGGGGCVIIVAETFVNNGTIDVSGGAAAGSLPGNASSAGGNGAIIIHMVDF